MAITADAHHAPAVHAAFGAREIGVRSLSVQDIFDALKLGFADFRAKPTHMFVLGLLYLAGAVVAAGFALDRDFVPLLFPIASGLALTGPFAAIILYEISRRREEGRDFAWRDAPAIMRRASSGGIAILGLFLFMTFAVWLLVAQAIFDATVGADSYTTPVEFMELVLSTPRGWALIALGNLAGLLFAAAVLATNVVSFPMLLDRNVGAPGAVATSLRVTAKNPLVIALWGAVIAGSLAAGAALFLVGLAVVIPVLGHASWRLYRKAVEPPSP